MSKARHGRLLAFAAVIIAVFVVFCQAEAPKNIIFCIGDGMGFNHVKATHYYIGTNLIFEAFPNQSTVMTYSADSTIPDSASSGTAMATGHKVNNGVISIALPGDGHSYQTLLEFLKTRGKRTALITTDLITDATPAVFGAHVSSRTMYPQIAAYYLTNSHPNVVLGGGDASLNETASVSVGYAYVTNAATLAGVADTNTFVMGSFGTGTMPYVYVGRGSLPGLTNMVGKALDILGNDSGGFFMMMEACGNDHLSHANNLAGVVQEDAELNQTVQMVLNWVSNRNDTLVIVTADHETGGLTNVTDNGAGNIPSGTWTTTGHSDNRVPVYGWGPGSEFISGVTNNTDYFPALTAMYAWSNTVDSMPEGLTVTVDSVSAVTPHAFLCTGTSVVMQADSPQVQASGDTRYVFDYWTNAVSGEWSTNRPFAFAIVQHTNWTAVFHAQYRQVFSFTPPGGGSIFPNGTVWTDAGSSVTTTAVTADGFDFSGWRDMSNHLLVSTNNPYEYAVTGPLQLEAEFAADGIGVTVQTQPLSNLTFSVDGRLYTNIWTFSWSPGAVHTVAVAQTFQPVGTGRRYAWTNWSDGGATSHVFTVTESDAGLVLTAEFDAQYQWTGLANPVSGGQVSPVTGWYAAGIVIPVTATPGQASRFVSWSGDITGTNPSVNIEMDGPRSATAGFSRLWFVATNGNVTAATGTAWTNALSLTNVLGRAGDGDEIWLKAGVYYPAPNTRSRMFSVKSGVMLYGGFAGTETVRESRNWTQYVSRLSGDIGIPLVVTDNCYRVVDVASNAVLDGVVVSDGYNTDRAGNWVHGDGMVRCCVFEDNEALRGGGLYADGNAVILNCIFRHNVANGAGVGANSFGGGILVMGGNPRIENGLFAWNQSTNGGAVAVAQGRAAFYHCTFAANAALVAPGVYAYNSGSAGFINSIFWDEGGDGGGIFPARTNGVSGAGLLDILFCDVRGGVAVPAEYLGVVTNVMDADPLFADVTGGVFRVQAKSPCVDAGMAVGMQMATDLVGQSRLAGRHPDMGAYEADSLIPPGWWSQYQLLPGTDAGDPDQDGYDNLAEYIAGTDPTNGLSMFAISNVRQTEELNPVLEWPSLTGREYAVYFTPAWTSDFTVATNHLLAESPLNVFTNGAQQGTDGFYRVSVSLQ